MIVFRNYIYSLSTSLWPFLLLSASGFQEVKHLYFTFWFCQDASPYHGLTPLEPWAKLNSPPLNCRCQVFVPTKGKMTNMCTIGYLPRTDRNWTYILLNLRLTLHKCNKAESKYQRGTWWQWTLEAFMPGWSLVSLNKFHMIWNCKLRLCKTEIEEQQNCTCKGKRRKWKHLSTYWALPRWGDICDTQKRDILQPQAYFQWLFRLNWYYQQSIETPMLRN